MECAVSLGDRCITSRFIVFWGCFFVFVFIFLLTGPGSPPGKEGWGEEKKDRGREEKDEGREGV